MHVSLSLDFHYFHAHENMLKLLHAHFHLNM